jgi:signal transduction histidine kinase
VKKATAPRSKGHALSATSKLAFVEALLAVDTLDGASQLGVQWLADRLGVKQVAIAIASFDSTPGSRLTLTASRGLVASALGDLGPDLDLDLDSVRGAFASRRCKAFPLLRAGRSDRSPIGLVLVGGVVRDPAFAWLLGVLSSRLVDLRDLRVLEAASSARSQRFSNTSHELRTPLNAILGYTSMLLEGVSGPLPPAVKRQLARVDSNAKQLLTIIDDALGIARLEAGETVSSR